MKLLILTCIILFVLFVVNIVKFSQQTALFQKKLNIQNKSILFVNNPTLNIKQECYQSENFFKMHNNGNNPCENIPDFQYIHYATKQDYYL